MYQKLLKSQKSQTYGVAKALLGITGNGICTMKSLATPEYCLTGERSLSTLHCFKEVAEAHSLLVR